MFKEISVIFLMPEVDYLLKDPIIPDGQNYCCLSLLLSDNKKTVKYHRVSCVFKTIEEAKEQIQLLKEPGHYNFVCEVGAWNAFDPCPNGGDLNDQLNNMMKSYLVGLQRKNFEFEIRKFNMIANNILDNKKIKEEELEKELESLKELTNLSGETNLSEEFKKKTHYIEVIKKTIQTFTEKIEENKKKELEMAEKLASLKINDNLYTTPTNESHNVPIKFEGKLNRTTEKLDNQNWYCISFLSEDNVSLVGVKISGCFDKEDDANQHSKALRDINDSFNILVGELYKWQPFNPDPDSLEAGDSEYSNEKLNDTMKKKKENEEKAKLFKEYQKYELINKNLQDSLTEKSNNREELSKKLDNIKDNEMKLSYMKELTSLDEQIAKLENKKKEITDKELELSEKIGVPEIQTLLQRNQ